MAPYIPVPDPVTPAWLTEVLQSSGFLVHGEVCTVTSRPTSAFNSATNHLQLGYSTDADPGLPKQLVLKKNASTAFAIHAGIAETKFYQLAARLDPPPPPMIPCYAAAYDALNGSSYILLHDLSATHTNPISRDMQVGVQVQQGVPTAGALDQVTETLARHHAYWWNHDLFETDVFPVGYWSRNAERFALYLRRRQTAWESLVTDEADWLPDDVRRLYAQVLNHIERHWERYLEPRFRTSTHLTLVHGDAYFANFLCPNDSADNPFLLDWQTPGVGIGGYDLANLIATFWTSEQRNENQREQQILSHYLTVLQAHGVTNYSEEQLYADYQSGLIYWLLMPVQDRHGGSPKEYWWPKMQCLVTAFREWHCDSLLGMA